MSRLKSYAKEIAVALLLLFIISNSISFYRANYASQILIKSMPHIFFKNENSKPVLYYFFASWCPTCKLELSNIEQISKSYRVIGVMSDSGDTNAMRTYLKSHNASFVALNDNNGAIAKTFGVKAFPTTIIYDSNGELFYSDIGYTSTLGLYIRLWLASI